MRQELVLINKVLAGILTEIDYMRYIFKYGDRYSPREKKTLYLKSCFHSFFICFQKGSTKHCSALL